MCRALAETNLLAFFTVPLLLPGRSFTSRGIGQVVRAQTTRQDVGAERPFSGILQRGQGKRYG